MSNALKSAFQNISNGVSEQSVVVTDSEEIDTKEIPFNPQWLGGFALGDGSFMIQIEHKGGGSFPRLVFLLTQHMTFGVTRK